MRRALWSQTVFCSSQKVSNITVDFAGRIPRDRVLSSRKVFFPRGNNSARLNLTAVQEMYQTLERSSLGGARVEIRNSRTKPQHTHGPEKGDP